MKKLFVFVLSLLLLLSSCATPLVSNTPPVEETDNRFSTAVTKTPEPSLSDSLLAQPSPTLESADAAKYDEFQAFIETWKLGDLITEGLAMTAENRSNFIEYFKQFDDAALNYVILLLQGIIGGTVTVTNDYDDPSVWL